MLELENILLRQGSFFLRADGHLNEGARCAVIGPSGAGKSTLLMALAGFLRPEQGRMRWAGKDMTQTAPDARPVSMLFQDNNLFPHMTVDQNIGLGLRPSLRLSPAERESVEQALEHVGLQGFGGRRPADLSGGQQSRVALARLLVQDRPLMLLDEPFAALGPALKIEMLGLVKDLCDKSGATLLMVSHDPSDARLICDQAILVANNIVHAPRATAELLDNPPEVLRDYLGK